MTPLEGCGLFVVGKWGKEGEFMQEEKGFPLEVGEIPEFRTCALRGNEVM